MLLTTDCTKLIGTDVLLTELLLWLGTVVNNHENTEAVLSAFFVQLPYFPCFAVFLQLPYFAVFCALFCILGVFAQFKSQNYSYFAT